MRKIIDGKLYDTTTADRICDISGIGGTCPTNDFKWEDTELYRTKKGVFFIAGRGGALSRWAEPTGNNGRTSGSGLEVVDFDTARGLVERFGDDEDYINTFGEPEEG